MKIIGLKVQNTFNLRAVRLKFDTNGDIVVFRGKNGAGKSNIANSIFYALTGKKPDDLIKQGADRSEIVVDLDEVLVKRVTTGKTMRVVVSGKPDTEWALRAETTPPQTLLNELFAVNTLAFNPLKLLNMSAKEQRALFMQIGGLDFTELDEKRAELFAERTVINRQLRNLEGTLNTLDEPDDELPSEKHDLLKYTTEADKLADQLAQTADLTANINRLTELAKMHKSRQQQITEQITALKIEHDTIDTEVAAITEQVRDLSDELDTLDIVKLTNRREKIVSDRDNAAEQNAQIDAAAEYRDHEKVLAEKRIEAQSITEDIEEIDDRKQKAIENAKFPIKGLSVDDERAYYKGVPLSQRSTGELTRIGMAIACSQKPKLKVVFIKNANVLDKEGRAAVEAYAEAQNYQLILELVGEKKEDESEILIEAGEVKT